MRVIADTHAIIWWLSAPDHLSAGAFAVLADTDNEILVSAASAYEIDFKRPRDTVLAQVPERLEQAVYEQGFDWLAISPAQAIIAARLPLVHRDPWDRILVAQALDTGAALLSKDPHLLPYGVPIIW